VKARSERGASAVEFAIIFPLLFLVIAGIIDFGRYFFTSIQVTNAAREGVRMAVVLPNPQPSDMTIITQRALNAAAGVPSVTVSAPATCAAGSNANATVQVQAPFNWIIMGPAIRLVGGSWAANGVVLSTGVMRCGG
jgi:Flp pilus assembly protein TadG